MDGPSCAVQDPIYLQLLSDTFSDPTHFPSYSYLCISRGSQASRLRRSNRRYRIVLSAQLSRRAGHCTCPKPTARHTEKQHLLTILDQKCYIGRITAPLSLKSWHPISHAATHRASGVCETRFDGETTPSAAQQNHSKTEHLHPHQR